MQTLSQLHYFIVTNDTHQQAQITVIRLVVLVLPISLVRKLSADKLRA